MLLLSCSISGGWGIVAIVAKGFCVYNIFLINFVITDYMISSTRCQTLSLLGRKMRGRRTSPCRYPGRRAERQALVGMAEATLALFWTGAEVDPLCSCSVLSYPMDPRWLYLRTSPEKNSSTSSRAAVGNSWMWDILT